MILITTAMILEARPLVQRLGLSNEEDGPFQTFSSEAFVLVVSGTGALRSSCATGWALGRYPCVRSAVNVGFCGAAGTVAPLHQWNYINSIRDMSTGRLSIPDVLWKHPFPEAGLLTSPRVIRGEIEEPRLVDMEGSGFFEAARQFLSPDNIFLLKWVSDPLTGQIAIEETAEAYAASLDPVVTFLKELADSPSAGSPAAEETCYEQITKRIRLSESQSHFLKSWLSGYLGRGGDVADLLDGLPDTPPASKRENNQLFERMKDALKG